MKILSITVRAYRGSPNAVEPMRLYFTKPLEKMGHIVECFDHIEASNRLGKEKATDDLVALTKNGGFDAVFYQSAGTSEPVDVSALGTLKTRVPLFCWNSDDDWQWERWTHKLAPHFTWVVTTYPHIYEANKQRYSNLLLSQWGCLESFSEFDRAKDIPFSFAGAVYKIRNRDCRFLRKRAGLKAFGQGARLVNLGVPYLKGAFRFDLIAGPAIDFSKINEIWNRTRVSYTPLGGGPSGEVMSIKSRVFDMGCSGTLMLSEMAPNLERYYEPGKEFVVFSSLDDCAEKARYFLTNESERARIAEQYRRRTLGEHTWVRRFQQMFADAGLQA
jgi:spore maturation protein CgeB